MSDIQKTLDRWKKEDDEIMLKLALAGWGFMLAGASGLVVLLLPFWFPVVHSMVYK
jgi:hypothetical protein